MNNKLSDATPQQVVQRLLSLVPEACAYRVHALTNSSRLNSVFTERLKISCNMLIPAYSGIILKPYQDYTGVTVMPHFFEDDTDLLGLRITGLTPHDYVCNQGLKIFDFHPVHVFLNSATFAQYEEAKPFYKQPDKLVSYRNTDSTGVADYLLQVIDDAKALGLSFLKISDILDEGDGKK